MESDVDIFFPNLYKGDYLVLRRVVWIDFNLYDVSTLGV